MTNYNIVQNSKLHTIPNIDTKIKDNGTFYIQCSSIGYTRTSSTVVYFVSDIFGGEYGQFNNELSAIIRYNQVQNILQEFHTLIKTISKQHSKDNNKQDWQKNKESFLLINNNATSADYDIDCNVLTEDDVSLIINFIAYDEFRRLHSTTLGAEIYKDLWQVLDKSPNKETIKILLIDAGIQL